MLWAVFECRYRRLRGLKLVTKEFIVSSRAKPMFFYFSAGCLLGQLLPLARGMLIDIDHVLYVFSVSFLRVLWRIFMYFFLISI
jgi:hypothetical protein